MKNFPFPESGERGTAGRQPGGVAKVIINVRPMDDKFKEENAMNVKIQSVKFDADKKLIDFTQAKVMKLDRFAENATGAEVFMKLDKDSDRGNKVVTIKLLAPGGELVAEHRSKTFEESVDEAIEALKKQIEKHKERFNK